MRKHTKQRLFAAVCILLGVLLGAGGIWVGDTDDAPGAAFLGLVLMAALFLYSCRLCAARAKSIIPFHKRTAPFLRRSRGIPTRKIF